MRLPTNPRTTNNNKSQELDAISSRLVEARLSAVALPEFPGQLPDNLEDAYAIQSASIARWPDDVVGWKIGMLPPDEQVRFSVERLAGPIFRSYVTDIDPGSCVTMPIYEGGFAAVEAEFIFTLGVAVQPVSRDYSDNELIDIVADLHVGIEIASSPMAMVNQLGPTSVVSDFGNNAGLLVGPRIPDWSSRPLESLAATVTVDDEVVGDASAAAIRGGPLQALRFLVQLCATRGLVLPEGTYVSTGAATGIHDVLMSSKSTVSFGAFGHFDIQFESMPAKQ